MNDEPKIARRWMATQRSREALRSALNAHREVTGRLDQSTTNSIIALNVVESELDRHEEEMVVYSLEDAQRDRIIVHARQDAAHALLNTITLLKRQRTNRALNVIALLLLAFISWQLL